MSKKKTEEKSTKKTSTTSVKDKILYEAVQENDAPHYIIVGALSKAGLLQQYEYEESVYGKEDLEPSITIDELKLIIKNFLR